MWEHVERYVDEQMNQYFADLLSAVVAAEGVLKEDPSLANPAEVVDLELVERAVSFELSPDVWGALLLVSLCIRRRH